MSGTVDFNRFEHVAQVVWKEPDLETKKKLINELMINRLAYPKKADKFRQDIAKATSPVTVDRLASDLVLIQSGDRVIR